MAHLSIDSKMDPIVFDVETPYEFQFQGKKFVYDPLIQISKKCNELGLNVVRVVKMEICEWPLQPKLRVILDVEAAR